MRVKVPHGVESTEKIGGVREIEVGLENKESITALWQSY